VKRIYKRENSVIIIIEEGLFFADFVRQNRKCVENLFSIITRSICASGEKTIIKVQELTRLERKKIKQKKEFHSSVFKMSVH